MLNIYTPNTSWLELNQNNFIHNLKSYRQILHNQELGLVVKCNAYGHGILEISKMAQNYVDILCTSTTTEALFLRQNNINIPILSMACIDTDYYSVINNNIKCTVYNLKDAISLNMAAQSLNTRAIIHIKIDTGMSRLGIHYKDAPNFIKKILNLKNINIEGIFTHLCDNTNPDPSFNYEQLNLFNELITQLRKNGINFKYTHAISSSGIYLNTNSYNMARLGAGAYGLFRSQYTKDRILNTHPNLNLKPISEWKSKIIHINHLSKNQTIGYGRTFMTDKQSKIAIVPVGYFDGYPRNLSNSGYVLVNCKKANIVGTISMNLLNIDITEIDAGIDTPVTILGGNIDNFILSENANSIPNNLFSSINPLIKRIII